MALSKDFFYCGWNIFDLIIVSASLLDLIFELVDGLSVLRGLRLVSTFLIIFKSYAPCYNYYFVLFAAASTEIGPVMDYYEGFTQHYHKYNRCTRKPYIRVSYSYLYLRRHRNAAFLQGLH